MTYRRVSDPERLYALLDAMMLIEADDDVEILLHQIVDSACELVGARYGALGVLNEAGTEIARFITRGVTDEESARIGRAPQGHGVLGEVIRVGKPIRIADLQRERVTAFPAAHPVMHSFLGVPVQVGSGAIYGNLYLSERHDGAPFSDEDEAIIVAFGRASGMVIEQSRRRDRVRDLTLLAERERMARDLHDTVIQRLFAVGLTLQSITTAPNTMDLAATQRIDTAIDDLDATIKEIRTTIFEISQTRTPSRDSLRAVLERIVADLPSGSNLRCELTVSDDVEAQVGPLCQEHLRNVVRELLSNVVRHAQATHVTVSLHSEEDRLVLRVHDDGAGGTSTEGSGRGLRNLRERAHALGGSFALAAANPTGTVATWTAREYRA